MKKFQVHQLNDLQEAIRKGAAVAIRHDPDNPKAPFKLVYANYGAEEKRRHMWVAGETLIEALVYASNGICNADWEDTVRFM